MSSFTPTLRRRQGAFTLMELLIVVAIVGILAAILIPVAGRARESARTAACQSSLRQIGAGAHLYLADNKNLMLPHQLTVNGVWRYWGNYLMPYMAQRASSSVSSKGYRNTVYCPTFETETGNNRTNVAATGYCWNGNFDGVNVATLDPARSVIAWDDVSSTNFDGGWPSATGTGSWYHLAYRHDGHCHFLFLDGHVEGVSRIKYGDARDYKQFNWNK